MYIRLATESDLSAINAIYNYYVLNSTATYQIEPSTPDERLAWFHAHDAEHPVTVVEEESAHGLVILGWGALSRFHERAAFRQTVEDSVYLHHDYIGRGIGKLLLVDLIERARAHGHHTIIGVVSAEQTPSLTLHQQLGFVHQGTLTQVGHKFDRWLDITYLQLTL
ncbi:TPA: N-acetyltransferase [Candidatus Sumerlaeota bacterium]|jgi:L-amino acid N-acyltransferase|nr:N-acetyltransferase [Candidatus Sumerlaeota bacterium]